MDTNKTALSLLNDVFGYDEFRMQQEAIINSVLKGKNTLALMPTGGGKSICYQIPSLLFDGLTLVISPLISLMHDQVRQLKALNINAIMLNSAVEASQYAANIQAIENNECKLVFLAPETAAQNSIRTVFDNANVSCIAIDEAHCISEWGHEFRPEYRLIHELANRYPNAVILALTATATPRVRDDIRNQLNIAQSNEFVASFNRDNLFIQVLPKEAPYKQTLEYVREHEGHSGIIYVLSRAGADELAEKLNTDGISAKPYHAGLNNTQREQTQEQFVRDDINIVVATIAFGMGINKPDVRFVLHYDLPKNIESYYQQIGRAGRDGLDAHCLLLFSYGDTGKIRYFIDQMTNEQEKRLASMHLNQMLALAETEQCRRIPLLEYFAEPNIKDECAKCDNCTTEQDNVEDLSIEAQKFLSCVFRTGQRFGASHIIDVLRGSNAERILQNQHNLLSTYGIGSERSKKQWMAISRKLIQRKYLKQDEQFGGLSLTPEAKEILQGKKPFRATLLQQSPSKKQKALSVAQSQADADLLARLKTKRKALADQDELPPYAVFSDRSLIEMAHFYPQSPAALLKIHGVGNAKLNTYGDIFLSIISEYCQEQNIQERENANKTSSKSKQDELSSRSIDIAEKFNSGMSLQDLSKSNKVKESTIVHHIQLYIDDGRLLSNTAHLKAQTGLNEVQLSSVLEAFEKHGTARLKPVFDEVDGQIDYDCLRIVKLLVQNAQNS